MVKDGSFFGPTQNTLASQLPVVGGKMLQTRPTRPFSTYCFCKTVRSDLFEPAILGYQAVISAARRVLFLAQEGENMLSGEKTGARKSAVFEFHRSETTALLFVVLACADNPPPPPRVLLTQAKHFFPRKKDILLFLRLC